MHSESESRPAEVTRMRETVYILCALTSLLCAGLLARNYLRAPSRLVLWSSLCFVGLGLNNVLLVVDLMVVTDVDLSLWRTGSAVAALLLLVLGLVWESR
jgi:hypothetical protein